MNKAFFFTLLCIQIGLQNTTAQNKDNDLIQFSGILLSSDSLNPVQFAHVILTKSYRGTVSDYYGFFSFVAQKGDTVSFSCVGYKQAQYIIPDTLTTNRYSLIQLMTRDTINLATAIVYPWPTREQFRQAFLTINIPDDDLARAKKNLALAEMKERMENMPMDGSMNYKYQMQQQQSKLYYAGQYPSISLLNPIAWAQFIQAWKRGDFKRKKKKK